MSLEIMSKLKFNQATGLHTIIEGGFRYEFPQSLLGNFKIFILRYDFVSRWYKHLSDDDKNKVLRTNAYE